MKETVSSATLTLRSPRRTVALLEILILAAGLGILFARVLPRAWVSLNTDFPNDYVAARLVRERYSVDRIYEWEWFEEQKHRMGVDRPMAGFIPHTPFSVVPMLPLTWLDPLTAKRAWIIFTLGLLGGSVAFISSISEVEWRWVAAAALLYLPLYRNLEYGQYYVLVLFLLSAALWCWQHNFRRSAGLLTALGAGLKIFPVVLFFFFLRKRDLRALSGFSVGVIGVVLASLACFGPIACVRFIKEILPSALHGEAMDPFALAANSISSLVRHVLVYNAQLNLHPIVNAPRVVGILVPLSQMVVLAPVILACSSVREERRDRLESSALIVVSLAISPLPASYNFVVLLLPCAVLFGYLRGQQRYSQAVACVLLYLLVGWATWTWSHDDGVLALIAVPRLWLLLLLSALFYIVIKHGHVLELRRESPWVIGLGLLTILQIFGFARHQENLQSVPSFVTVSGLRTFIVASPRSEGNEVCFHAMASKGWTWAVANEAGYISEVRSCPGDSTWLIEHSGHHSLWARDANSRSAIPLSDDHDVYDFSTRPGFSVVFSAMAHDGLLHLYRAPVGEPAHDLGISNARFPAISPDQRWLAYSSLENGYWHLRILDLINGHERQLTSADCNAASPVWGRDSKRLYYVSDCGRGLWQTALASTQLSDSAPD